MISKVDKDNSNLSRLGLNLKGFNLSYYSHQAPAFLLMVFFVIMIAFLLIIALIDPTYRLLIIILIVISCMFFAKEFHNDPTRFLSEKGILKLDKQRMSAKGNNTISEGEIIEVTQPIFAEIEKPIKKKGLTL